MEVEERNRDLSQDLSQNRKVCLMVVVKKSQTL